MVTATTEIYTYCHPLSLHDALPISPTGSSTSAPTAATAAAAWWPPAPRRRSPARRRATPAATSPPICARQRRRRRSGRRARFPLPPHCCPVWTQRRRDLLQLSLPGLTRQSIPPRHGLLRTALWTRGSSPRVTAIGYPTPRHPTAAPPRRVATGAGGGECGG